MEDLAYDRTEVPFASRVSIAACCSCRSFLRSNHRNHSRNSRSNRTRREAEEAVALFWVAYASGSSPPAA